MFDRFLRPTRVLVCAVTVPLVLANAAAWANAAPPSAQDKPASGDKAATADAAAPDAVVVRAIVAGLANQFEGYLAEVLPDLKETAEQKSQMQRYVWKRFSGQAAWYVADPAKPTMTVARRQAISETKVKLFIKDLKNKDAMPRPIELTKKDGRWFISSNSL